MWAVTLPPHFGSLPLKKWLLRILAVVAVAFLYSAFISPTTHAADASWDNGSIRYNDTTFQGPNTANGDSSNGLRFAEGVTYYTSDSEGERSIIYFDANQDPSQAIRATYIVYDFQPPDSYSNPSTPKQISISEPGAEAGASDKEQTSCAVNGIGYILCPIMSFISDGMDWVFEQIQGFMRVSPLTTGESSLYKAWNLMRSFANIAFVVAFLVFIYSYITGLGVNQHDLRKMIPRLIIAAVLVNASYVISAVAVDLSNVAGASLQDIFIAIRDQLAASNTETNELESVTWSAMTAYILSGGTIAAAGLVQLSAAGGGLIYMLFPILSIAGIAIVVTVAVLAARQALIVILIIISPIAFVAFVLPGTQKYFDKWRDIFQTMLLLYPIFSVLFGGSQLAGYLIAQNAQRAEILVLAMFVQVAPLIITPFLIKFSGGLLGKFAGMVNDPAKGAHDRVKNWSNSRVDQAKARRLAENRPGIGLARKLDNMRRREEMQKKFYESKRNRQFNNSQLARNLAIQQMREDDKAAAVDSTTKAAYEELKHSDKKMQVEAAQVKIAELEFNVQKAKADAFLSELQTDAGAKVHSEANVALASLSSQLRKQSDGQQIIANRASIAEGERRTDYANRLVEDRRMQNEAAGVGGEAGRMIAAAHATQAIREDANKNVAASTELYKHFNRGLGNAQIKELAHGGSGIVGKDSAGREFTFDASEIGGAMHEAAANKYMQETNAEGFDKYVQYVSDHQDQGYSAINSNVKDTALKMYGTKLPYLAGKTLDMMEQGKLGTKSRVKGEGHIRSIMQTIEGGKFSKDKLATMDPYAIEQVIKSISKYNDGDAAYRMQVEDSALFNARATEIMTDAQQALIDNVNNNVITTASKEQLEILSKMGQIR